VYLHPNPCQSQSLNCTTHTKLDNRTQLYMSFNQMSVCMLLASMNNIVQAEVDVGFTKTGTMLCMDLQN
jgi:hypothetical protein